MQDDSNDLPEWKREYLKGTGYEVYRVALTPVFEGCLYSEVQHSLTASQARDCPRTMNSMLWSSVL